MSDTATAQQYLLFFWKPTGYELVERDGAPPQVGAEVELEGQRQRVTKIGASPLPADPRPCAYLIV